MAIPQPPKLDQIETPPPPGLLGGWGEKLEITVVRFVIQIFNALMEPFLDAVDKGIDWFLEKVKEELKPIGRPLLDRIESIPGLPPEIQHVIDQTKGTPAIPAIAIIGAALLGAIVQIAIGLGAPYYRIGQYAVENLAHSARMSPAEAYQAKVRGALGLEDYNTQFDDAGWSDELRAAWEGALKPLMDLGDMGRLYIRQDISEREFTEALAQRGYDVLDINRAKTLLRVIPPLADIIRMSVREAFTPEVVSRFNLHAELPAETVEWAQKQGLDVEWAKAYWAAHWELPPLTMGFEMLHRGIIERDDMELLIRTHDISPYWRDKLIQLSYDPYTRVDIRRMLDLGIVGKDEVYKNYRDLGYDHEKATNLTTFAVALTNEPERDLTKTDILYGYEHGFFDRQMTATQLMSLNYDELEAEYYITKVDYKVWQKVVDETVKYLKQQYISGRIDKGALFTELGKVGVTAEQMQRYVNEWDIQKQAKPRQLTSEKLAKFRTQGVIGDDDFRREMSGLGYSDLYIKWYLDSIKKGG